MWEGRGEERVLSISEEEESGAGGPGSTLIIPPKQLDIVCCLPSVSYPLYNPAHTVNGARSGLGNIVTSFHLI